jgi:hypothetical protein
MKFANIKGITELHIIIFENGQGNLIRDFKREQDGTFSLIKATIDKEDKVYYLDDSECPITYKAYNKFLSEAINTENDVIVCDRIYPWTTKKYNKSLKRKAKAQQQF